MADTKLSALPSVATPAGTDQIYVNQGGVSKKLLLSQAAGFSGPRPYDEGGVTVATGNFLNMVDELRVTGTLVFAVEGTGLVIISDILTDAPVYIGTPRIPTSNITVPDGWTADILGGLSLRDRVVAVVQGTGELWVIDDFASRGLIVLAGRGG